MKTIITTFIRKLSQLETSKSPQEKFRDFCELAYCAYAKRMAEPEHQETLEARYIGLVPSETLQQGLFSRYPQERIHPLMKALDDVNGLYGPGTLRYGSEGFEKPWKIRQKHLSQPIVPGRGSEFQNVRPVCELGTSASLVRSMVLK